SDRCGPPFVLIPESERCPWRLDSGSSTQRFCIEKLRSIRRDYLYGDALLPSPGGSCTVTAALEKSLFAIVFPVDPAAFKTPNAASLILFLSTSLLLPWMKTPARSLCVIQLSFATLPFPTSSTPSKISESKTWFPCTWA